MQRRYLLYHGLCLFYTAAEAFERFCSEFDADLRESANGAADIAGPVRIDRQAYSDLIYGTDADFYAPLWASACKGRGDILLNETTLEVIKTYKEYGYEAVCIDGHPADYVGEQLRFLEHICAWALNGSMDKEAAAELLRRFTEDYLLDSLKPSLAALRGEERFSSMARAAEMMEELISDGGKVDITAERRGARHERYTEFESFKTKRGPALPLEAPHKVSIASFCDCGSKCKNLALVQEGCVLSIEPDEKGTPLRFTGCPRGMAYPYTYLSARRLRYPMVRREGAKRGEGKFRRISWEEAVSRMAGEIERTGKEYGPESRFVIAAAGVCAAVRGDRFMKSLLALDGGYLEYYNYYSAACAVYILPYVYGEAIAGNHPSTYVHSDFILLWGFNPSDGHFSFGMKEGLIAAKEAGAEIWAIDPIEHDGVLSLAERWIPIRPGSDAALADAMAYVIMRDGLWDREFTDSFCLGFDEEHMPEGVPEGESYKSYLFGEKDGTEKTPEWAEKITGIPAETIREIARRYAKAKSAALLPGLGLQRSKRGEQACRCLAALACLTGNVGKSGGSPGGFPDWTNGFGGPAYEHLPNPYPGAIPLFHWSRAVEKPETLDPVYLGLRGVERLNSGIKLLFNLGSSILLNQHSDINDTARILRDETGLETLVVSELLMTPAARFADILLPGASFFEVDNIVGPWSPDVYFLFNNACTKPLFESRFEYEWVRETAEELGYCEALDEGKESKEAWLRFLYEDYRKTTDPELPPYEEFRASSFYALRPERMKLLAFEDQIKGGAPFDTPSGKIEIFSKTLYELGRPEDIPGIPRYLNVSEGPEDPRLFRKTRAADEAETFGSEGPEELPLLQLISYHTKKRCHSQHDQNPLLRELDPSRLWMNPADAALRGLSDGELVEVYNSHGRVHLPLFITERIAKGVVAMSEGGWYKPDKSGADIGGSINVLTSTEEATPIANGNPQQTNLAQVRRAG